MLVTNLGAAATNPERETGPRPNAPPPPLGDPRREPGASFGPGGDPAGEAEEAQEFGREGQGEVSPTAVSAKGEALQAQALVTTLGEERARLAYDEDLSRMIVEILDPQTGDVITRFPSERLVEQLSNLAANDKSDAAPVKGLSELIGAPAGGATGKVLDELV